jgi:isocitrate dehydrogenase kinase/phosphatase
LAIWRKLKLAKARREAWNRLFPPRLASPLEDLTPEGQSEAYQLTQLVLAAHRRYISDFDACTRQAQLVFETRDWKLGAVNPEARATLYRAAILEIWREVQLRFPTRLVDRRFWMGARQLLLEQVFDDYDADLELTFFYSTMRISFGDSDVPVEYADDGLAERQHLWNAEPVRQIYPASQLSRSIEQILRQCGFRAAFKNMAGDAQLAASRLLSEWRQRHANVPRYLQILKPVFFRDQEAYLVGKLCDRNQELPVVLALKHEPAGITIEAVLAGKEDMRNILFVSTRSTFHVGTGKYREVLNFLDTLAPDRGHPGMCAVIGFTHPARVALNAQVRRHLEGTSEQFTPTPGRIGTAMIVFSPPSFPYVFKVIRDTSAKIGWAGKQRIMDLYRWVHETNRGRLMLDAWMYRNLHFSKHAFQPEMLDELCKNAASSVRVLDDTIVLKDVYAQRRVLPLNTFFDKTSDRALREKAVDALGNFVKDLARMGFFVGEYYGLTFNTGLTHALNVTLFDFDDLRPLLDFRFRKTPEMDEKDELLWNGELDGPWFSVDENDVLVDEWERYLGVPPDLRDYFRRAHGDLFTTEFWTETQQRVRAGQPYYVQPYPPERRLSFSAGVKS